MILILISTIVIILGIIVVFKAVKDAPMIDDDNMYY